MASSEEFYSSTNWYDWSSIVGWLGVFACKSIGGHTVSTDEMKALRCPGCGSGQFHELTGKRHCICCGTEFEGNKISGTYLGDGAEERSIYTGPGSWPDLVIVKRDEPGIAAGDWERQIRGIQLEVGQAP